MGHPAFRNFVITSKERFMCCFPARWQNRRWQGNHKFILRNMSLLPHNVPLIYMRSSHRRQSFENYSNLPTGCSSSRTDPVGVLSTGYTCSSLGSSTGSMDVCSTVILHGLQTICFTVVFTMGCKGIPALDLLYRLQLGVCSCTSFF